MFPAQDKRNRVMELFLQVIVVLVRAASILAIIHLLMDNRQQAKTIAWALIIFFIPLVGIIAYLFFGVNTRRKRRISRGSMAAEQKRAMLSAAGVAETIVADVPEDHRKLSELFTNQSMSLPLIGQVDRIFTTGRPFFDDLIGEIRQARNHIHINMYIFDNDELGVAIAEALKQKAREGIEVRLVYDDVGCWPVPDSFFDDMKAAGVAAYPFLPVRFPKFARKANYRDHRKFIVIDGRKGYIGGMNIARRYRDGVGERPWRDTMVKVCGPAVYGLQRAFLVDWHFVGRALISDKRYYPDIDATAAVEPIQVVTSSPFEPMPELMQGYVRLVNSARRYVYIETPYFMPTESVMLALKTAVLSGVDVRVIVPHKGDSHFVELASQSYLREAADAGVRILLYEPGFIHSKMLVSDDSVATCGSTNIDYRSFENNFEANAFFYGADTAVRFRDIFLADQQHSIDYSTCPACNSKPLPKRILESAARLMAPLF